MKPEAHFEKWHSSSHIAEWIELNPQLAREIYASAYRAISRDRQALEGMLQNLDYEDELREQEDLGRGLG